MENPYSSVTIANTFLSFYGKNNSIEHMKLQKLVYCSYGWWLANFGLNDKRLTSDKPEIWRHGPVFPELYQFFKIFGRKLITEPQSATPFSSPEIVGEEDENVVKLIKWVWSRYGHLSSFALSDLTHRSGTPWHRTAVENNFSVPFNTTIKDEYILEEFKSIMEREAKGNFAETPYSSQHENVF